MEEVLQCSETASSPTVTSNRGLQLLKKHGWKEGTGLGLYEQGRLEPVEAYVKNNRKGLGADKKMTLVESSFSSVSKPKKVKEKDHLVAKKSKSLTKKQRKMQLLEQQLQEKEFDRAFYREFWPDNV